MRRPRLKIGADETSNEDHSVVPPPRIINGGDEELKVTRMGKSKGDTSKLDDGRGKEAQG